MPVATPENQHAKRLRQLKEKGRAVQGDLLAPAAPPKAATPAKAPAKKPAKHDQVLTGQADMFAPLLCDVGARDTRGVMDVAPFRLSKTEQRANALIRYELPDGYVQVTSGVYGMATVWDYDIVLMAVSHLNEAMNRYRAGKGEKPGPIFRPHVTEVLSFCRKNMGGNQKDMVVDALHRLSTTHVSIERTKAVGGKSIVITEGENLIGPFKVISTPRKKVDFIEIRVADWMYQEITAGSQPDVLTVHPDYFLITSGVGRFIYRLARKAAGKDMATWGFSTLFTRSGSSGKQKEFNRLLREVIAADNLPEYSLAEEAGQMGPVLRMVHRGATDQYKLKT